MLFPPLDLPIQFFKLVGRSLKKARLQAGLSQVDLAHKTGFSVSSVSQIERGRPSNLSVIQTMVRALDGDLHTIFSSIVCDLVKTEKEKEFFKSLDEIILRIENLQQRVLE